MVDKQPLTFTLEDLVEADKPRSTPRGKATFQIDSRSNKKGDQRQQASRRCNIRFQDDRRSGADRRASAEIWDNTHSI